MKHRARKHACARRPIRFVRGGRGKAPSRGLTLLELLVCSFVVALIAVSTMRALGDGRVMRERAKHRAELALLAQSELDRLRSLPMAKLAEGQQAVHREAWPQTVSAVETVRKRGDGFLEISVGMTRKSPGGDFKAALVSIHPGGRR